MGGNQAIKVEPMISKIIVLVKCGIELAHFSLLGEDTERRQLSTSQEVSSHLTPDLPVSFLKYILLIMIL